MSAVMEAIRQKMLEDKAAREAADAAGAGIDPLIGNPVMPPDAVVQPVEAKPEPVKGPPGSYRSLRLERFFLSNGQKVVPNADGFFIPETDEEKTQLQHFATQWGMVEYQGDPE